MRFKSPKAEEMRLRALYRGMALRGEALPSRTMGFAALRRLIGPDCAYHLYGRHKGPAHASHGTEYDNRGADRASRRLS
jgi:hypothetical protein